MTDALVPVSTDLALTEDELDIQLMEGEEILYAGRPLEAKLCQQQFWRYMGAWGIFTIVGVGFLGMPFCWPAARAYAAKHRFWLTNKRVVVTSGMIGHWVKSIPLERVSDVAVGCDWLEKWLGIRSVYVTDMSDGGVSMWAVPEARKVQQMILKAVRERNASGDAVGALGPAPGVYRDDGGMLVALLQEIAENTRK